MYIPILLIETVFAITIIAISANIFITHMYLGTIGNKNQMNQYNSVFDFFYATANNRSYSSYLDALNKTGVENELENFSATYRLQFISVQIKGFYVSYGNSSLCQFKTFLCIPERINGSFSPLCVAACSD
jgi:hypothetical protein